MSDLARKRSSTMMQQMKLPPRQRPILFSGPMVRAVLNGRKIQTRRVIKPQPQVVGRDRDGQPVAICDGEPIHCRFGQPNDQLWVRERWNYRHLFTPKLRNSNAGEIVYAADAESINLQGIWKQSRSMPRIASRIMLEISEVRIQRLCDIDKHDAVAEGFDPSDNGHRPIKWFRELWDSLNCDGQFAWDSNPWVWVVGFRVLNVAKAKRRYNR